MAATSFSVNFTQFERDCNDKKLFCSLAQSNTADFQVRVILWRNNETFYLKAAYS